MKISKKLKINKAQLELDFFDYELNKDTYLFFDPYYISKKEDPFLAECNNYIESFFNRFLDLLKRDPNEAYKIFKHLGEVNEICLGMSKGKPSGRGIGSIGSKTMFNAIRNCDAVKNNIATSIEDIRIFVKNIGKDKISDMVANIIKLPLIKYTQEQSRLHGFKLANTEVGYYWNASTASWDRGHKKIIVIKDEHYLLYPKNLVSDSKFCDAAEYLKMYVLTYLQEENIKNDTHLVHKTFNRDGTIKSAKVYKKEILEDFASHGEFLTKNWLANFTKNNYSVYEKFKADTIKKISDGEIGTISQSEINDIIDKLIDELRSIPEGVKNATRYHRLVSGILELIFYPSLAHPKIEKEINDGRKRIDLSFCNIAEKGFFRLLCATYNIPCVMIIIECKNYSEDIANPELDQISGRFSPNRGKFGIVCCRKIEDKNAILLKERDTVKDQRGWIIHLTDCDIIYLLECKKSRDGEKLINEFLLEKLCEINNS